MIANSQSAMTRRHNRRMTRRTVRCVLTALLVTAAAQRAAAQRPMTFLDVQHLRTIASPAPSPDGKWLLHTLSTPDWKEARRQTDIHLVSLQQGLASSRQMTFTTEKNETSPAWSPDGRAFAFLSNREAPENAPTRNQVYLMRPDGGEARRITDAKDGVQDFALSRDGKGLAVRGGPAGAGAAFPP